MPNILLQGVLWESVRLPKEEISSYCVQGKDIAEPRETYLLKLHVNLESLVVNFIMKWNSCCTKAVVMQECLKNIVVNHKA